MTGDEQERLYNTIDKLDTRLDSIDTTLIKQSVSLDEHIRRTNLLEDEMKPVKQHVVMVEAVFKILGVVSVIASIVAAFIDIKR